MVSTGEFLGISQSSILLPQFRSQASNRGLHSLSCYQVSATAFTECKFVCLLKARSDLGVLSQNIIQRQTRNLFPTVVRASVAPEKVPTALADLAGEGIEIQPDNGNGGGDIGGIGGDGEGGGSNWGNNNNDGEGGSDDSDKSKKMGMSMSQKLTLGYAALVGLGGVMGYLKSGSQKSLLAGGISASLLYYVYTQLPTNPVFASCIGLGLSGALLAVMGSRFMKSGKVFPAGVVSIVSLVMTGGYLHGVMRSMH